ncbi:hypothetical protein [Isoptericola variabilis]|uniref:Uncharacterized protein n=1 Tax=Isoptericola variabilis (strain 225) TaxID=743718 RepID=F6FWE8_ISOV2|nr:hypothetical protein [Isoptericola variabilis]AEG44522.1 hypothetical protein Isova_1775 [Isoptericola variabilis 225]TWH26562.1 hypothetical protein L600_000600000420 [Isoptericola variabilis J7]
MDDDARDRSVRRWLPTRLAVIALAVAVALVVALVARPPARVAVETYPGLPPAADVPPETFEPGWVLDPQTRRLAVYAAGSSSCPYVASDVQADGDLVTVTLSVEERGPCTDDLAWTTSVVAVPDGVDLERLDVEVVLDRWP